MHVSPKRHRKSELMFIFFLQLKAWRGRRLSGCTKLVIWLLTFVWAIMLSCLLSITHREKESILVTYQGHSLPAASCGDACLASPRITSSYAHVRSSHMVSLHRLVYSHAPGCQQDYTAYRPTLPNLRKVKYTLSSIIITYTKYNISKYTQDHSLCAMDIGH